MSSDNNETRQVQIAVADPTPLGLFFIQSRRSDK